jgi:hypothetical protein
MMEAKTGIFHQRNGQKLWRSRQADMPTTSKKRNAPETDKTESLAKSSKPSLKAVGKPMVFLGYKALIAIKE